MNLIITVSIIVLLLIALVSYVFVSQTLERRRKAQQRLLNALKHKQRNFKAMLASFPPGFLSQDLTLLIYRALLSASEQLSKLEPSDSSHVDEVRLYTSQLEATKNQAAGQRGKVENPQQALQVRAQLQELMQFVGHQAERGSLNRVQAQSYSDQIKRLALQAAVDAYILQAKEAQGAGKLRLAVHHYTLARKLLVRENAGLSFQKQVSQLDALIAKLQARINETEPAAGGPDKSGAEPAGKEWEQFSEEDDAWKKKQIYD